MSCSNCPPEACYNGCVNVISDKCVSYTGIDFPELGISTGDTLLSVEETLITKVISFLDGTGIDITIDPEAYCALVTEYLPEGTPNLVEVLTALVKAACDLQDQVVVIDATLATLNADYTIGCLEGVTASSDTHAIVQAIITKLCTVETDLTALTLDVDTNYVKLADLNALIAAYISGTGGSVQNYTKMVPYTAVEYYGPLANFDGTGAGISALGWDKIYLCNGLNDTPDKRGRVAVGAIVDVPGGPLNVAVDPAYTGNPSYEVYDALGANTVALTLPQIPNHTHTANPVTTVTEVAHTHHLAAPGGVGVRLNSAGTLAVDYGWSSTASYDLVNSTSSPATLGLTDPVKTNVAVSVSVTNDAVGNNVAHANIQPVLACYYIMYIPS